MVRAFRGSVFRDVVGACWPPAERPGGGGAAQSPERARHERLRLRLANGIRTTLEDGALCARRAGRVRPKAELQNRTSNVTCWPQAAENDVRSNVGYQGVKRTRSAHAEFFAF